MSRPVLIVGDIQGDDERLAEALAPYPDIEVDTIFLGDFFQGGRLGAAGGAKAAGMARSRRNSRTVLGNHDVFILCVLEVHRGNLDEGAMRFGGSGVEEFWRARRGDDADLEALAADSELEMWLRSRPLMLRLDDGTLVQHADDVALQRLGDSVTAVNHVAAQWLTSPGGLVRTARHLIGRHAFASEPVLSRYLAHFDGSRLVHGHTPHWSALPEVSHEGRLIGFDGRFSRFWGRTADETAGPIEATVGLLPPLG